VDDHDQTIMDVAKKMIAPPGVNFRAAHGVVPPPPPPLPQRERLTSRGQPTLPKTARRLLQKIITIFHCSAFGCTPAFFSFHTTFPPRITSFSWAVASTGRKLATLL
jgi:hypothetical protein